MKEHPDLLTPEVHSPIFHDDGTMTIIWDSVIPYVDARYGAAKRWAVGGSNGASFAAHLALGRPDLFSDGAFYKK